MLQAKSSEKGSTVPSAVVPKPQSFPMWGFAPNSFTQCSSTVLKSLFHAWSFLARSAKEIICALNQSPASTGCSTAESETRMKRYSPGKFHTKSLLPTLARWTSRSLSMAAKAFDGCTKYAAARAAGDRVKKKPSLTRLLCFRTNRGMFVIAAIDMLLAKGSAFKPRSMSFTSTPAISMGGAPSRLAASPQVIRPCQSSTTRFSMMPR
mmetsp:Transcript_32224/g.74812  ORF Transcript_32224/g.74812 Transcript_32224/m.74812 type:complete len:208 (+) Transcript_32224:502-1125(+)